MFTPGNLVTVRSDYRHPETKKNHYPLVLFPETINPKDEQLYLEIQISLVATGVGPANSIWIKPGDAILYLVNQQTPLIDDSYKVNRPAAVHLFLHQTKLWYTLTDVDFALSEAFERFDLV